MTTVPHFDNSLRHGLSKGLKTAVTIRVLLYCQKPIKTCQCFLYQRRIIHFTVVVCFPLDGIIVFSTIMWE